MARPAQMIEMLLFLAVAAVLAWFGVSVPVHFRASSPNGVERAGIGTRGVEDLTRDYMLSGDVGPVRLLWEADRRLPTSETDRQRMRELVQREPQYWLTGGPAPYYEAFLRIIEAPVGQENEKNVLQVVLPRGNRRALAGYLSGSANLGVQHLLSVRNLAGWRDFMPVNSPAGGPLDASLLTLALLVQSDVPSLALRREIQRITLGALQQDREALNRLEDALLAVLSLGRQMDWAQMAELVRVCDSPQELVTAGRMLVANTQDFPQVYAAGLLMEDFDALAAYLEENGEVGMDALSFALPKGRGAVEAVIDSGKVLYTPPAFVRWLDEPLSWVRRGPLLAFSLRHPTLALDVKVVLLLMAGYCLALGAMRMLSLADAIPPLSVTHPLILSANTGVAIMFTILLWALVEPNLLRFADTAVTQLHLEFGISMPLESLESQKMTPTQLDQATILALLLFLFVQFAVYVFGLLKLAKVRRQELPARTKIELLENEENLFDLGLYVGLGGTVASLVMLAMDIVQASLIAAYSSTLFGILFTALLKIVHVRTYRNRLIIEARAAEAPPAKPAPATAPSAQ